MAHGAGLQDKTKETAVVSNAALDGQILAPDGQPLAHANVTIENLDTHRSFQSVSDVSGHFSLANLPVGNYRMRVAKKGYKLYVVHTLPLVAGDQAKAVVPMQKGSSTETVEGAANSVTSRIGTSLAGKELNDIPENQRNFVNLAQLTSGANEGNTNGSSSGAQPGAQHSSSSVSVGGQLETLNNNLIDGVDNNDRINSKVAVHPSVDAIAGMKIAASAYPATMGRAGGGVIDITTKSGAKGYHGGLYEYFRNDALDAYPYLFGAHTRHPEVRQNQYGGSLGGPLWKNKTYFFADYEAFRLIQGQAPVKLTVPTTYEHDNPGDFTDIGGTKLTTLDSVGLKYFKLYPYPNSGTTTYVSAPSGMNFTHTGDLRIDHQFSPHDQFFGRFSYNYMTVGIPSAFPTVTEDGMTIRPGGQLYMFAGDDKMNMGNGALSYTHTFRPNLTLNLKAGYTIWNENESDLNPNYAVNQGFGQPGVNVDSSSNGLAPISVAKAAPLGNGGYFRPMTMTANTFHYLGLLKWTVGRHVMSMGGGLIRRQYTYDGSWYGLGYWTVTDLPSLLQGQFTSVQRNLDLVQPHYRTWEPSGYFADDWNIVHNLTISWGVRYDVYTPPTAVKNQIANFDPATGKIIVAGTDGVSNTGNVNTDYSSFMPRIGFNWTPDGETSIHGGFGIVSTLAADTTLFKIAPFVYSYGVCSSTTCASGYTRLADGLPTPSTPDMANPSGNIQEARSMNLKNIYLEQFNLGVDRSLGKYDSFRVSYVGSLGRHITRLFPDLNAPSPNDPSKTLVASNTLRPYYSVDPNLTTVSFIDSGGSSSYNALQAGYVHTTKFGVNATLNYTLAHGLDDARPWAYDTSGFGTVVSKSNTIDYGNSTFDVRHHLVSTVMYKLPFGQSATGKRQIAEKGWQFNVIEVWGTGLPFTVVNATDVSNTNPGASSADRPNVTGNPNLSTKSINEFFNTAAFSAQTTGTLGNERRNQYHGPHSRHTDVSLFKDFQLPRAMTMQFRTECFNVTNTANFATPAAVLNGANFGQLTQITSGYTPREIQFALRMQF